MKTSQKNTGLTPEQIKAWLTIEGWVPTAETDERWGGMQRDNVGAWYENEAGYTGVQYSDSGLAEGRVFCTWDDMPDWVCLQLYEWAIKENMI